MEDTNQESGPPQARPTPEAFRYAANLDLGKETMRTMIKDAADQMERMNGVMHQLQSLAVNSAQKVEELELIVQQKDDVINRLNALLNDGAKDEGPSEPPPLHPEDTEPPAPGADTDYKTFPNSPWTEVGHAMGDADQAVDGVDQDIPEGTRGRHVLDELADADEAFSDLEERNQED